VLLLVIFLFLGSLFPFGLIHVPIFNQDYVGLAFGRGSDVAGRDHDHNLPIGQAIAGNHFDILIENSLSSHYQGINLAALVVDVAPVAGDVPLQQSQPAHSQRPQGLLCLR
jgi:hypothetical protein